MAYVKRTIIVPLAMQAFAQALCKGLAGPAGDGMFTTPLSATGTLPATHYISSGMIDQPMAALLADANLIVSACAAATPTVPCTLAQAQALLAAATITDCTYAGVDEAPLQTIARLGLKMIQARLP